MLGSVKSGFVVVFIVDKRVQGYFCLDLLFWDSILSGLLLEPFGLENVPLCLPWGTFELCEQLMQSGITSDVDDFRVWVLL